MVNVTRVVKDLHDFFVLRIAFKFTLQHVCRIHVAQDAFESNIPDNVEEPVSEE